MPSSCLLAFLQYYEAMELSKTLMEKCENAVLESEVLVHMREQVHTSVL